MSDQDYAHLPVCPACGEQLSREEDVIAEHYEKVHGVSIYSECADCGQKFISLNAVDLSTDPFKKQGFRVSYCPECRWDDPLNGLVVEEVVEFE